MPPALCVCVCVYRDVILLYFFLMPPFKGRLEPWGGRKSWREVVLLERSPHANLEPRCQPEQ